MAFPRPLATLAIAAILVLAGCGPAPDGTPAPTGSGAVASGGAMPAATDVPFAPTAWPFGGSACDQPGYTGEIGRITATDAHTVTFTLCIPDGAFLARLAHPSLGIVDAAALGSLATDPTTATSIAGAGPYRIAGWNADNVRLERVGESTGEAASATVILRWDADPSARAAALRAASVDGIDNAAAGDVDAVATSPELTVVPRPGLATAYLGFGLDAGFGSLPVRRAIAMGVDRASLLAAFPAGSAAADHLAPCDVPSGCTGTPFPGFNGPAAAAAMKVVGLDLSVTWPLHVPDASVPGLPDPAGVAAALRDQLGADIGLQLAVDVMPLATFRKREAAGTLDGLYLDGFASVIPDAAAFLAPLVTGAPHGLPARRASGVATLLGSAAAATDAAGRGDILTRAASKMRASVAVVPLAHAGSAAIFRSDVTGVAVAPLGNDALGAMSAGDRHQVVFLQATAPDDGWCGDQPSTDAYRLCALVTSGLYGFGPGSLVPIPRLASDCAPDPDARTWTCHLRTAHDAAGRPLDAGDVVATFRAMWDAASAQHAAAAPGSFSAWQALFGGFADLNAAP
jgi:peptide/nickel transport system substrate-binding protein